MKTLTIAASGFRTAFLKPLVCLIPIFLAATAASATTINLGSVSNPTFPGGTLAERVPVSISNGVLSVTVTIGDVGVPAQLFIAAFIPAGSLGMTADSWFCLTSNDGWRYAGTVSAPDLTAFTPVASALAAGSNWKVAVLQNVDFSTMPKSEVYVGYGASFTEMLQASRYKGVASVR